MFCTNCGTKVDDSAKFCPVCGNKLANDVNVSPSDAPQASVKTNQTQTFEPVSTDENLIENKADAKPKNKFKAAIDNLKLKKPAKKPKGEDPEATSKASENLPEDLGAVGQVVNYNNQTPAEALNDKLGFEDEMPPSYYGYDPTDDRKRKELRHQYNDAYIARGELEARIGQRVADTRAGEQLSFTTYEPSTQGQAVNANGAYDDIPHEYLEARIARQFQTARGENQAPTASGNIAGAIRGNQASQRYRAYDQNQTNTRPTEVSQTFEPEPKLAQAQVDKANEVLVADPPAEDKPKREFKFKPIYLLPLVLLLIGLAIGYFFINRKPDDIEVDLSDYIDVTYTGDDGSGEPHASINTSSLLANLGNQVAYTNKDRKDDSYGAPANQFIDELEAVTVFQFSKDGNLSNGEEITVVANVSDSSLMDDYNVMFTNTIKSVIVDGLITQEYVDAFQYINVEFEGEAPNISLIASLTEDAPPYMSMVEIAPSKTTELDSGEEVNVSLIYDEDEMYDSYGLRFDAIDKIYTVPGEAEDELVEEDAEIGDTAAMVGGYISTVDSLDEELLGTLKYDAGQLIRNTFEERSFTEISEINYLGAITGSDANASDLNNRVMLVYEIKANENYEGRYTNEFTYYSFVEYQNVRDSKDESGSFYSQGPMTTENEIYHKFFVEEDYTYYEIPYYGFGFLEEVITRINNALSGLSIDDSIAVDVSQYFASSDGVVGEYQGNGTRLTLNSDGSLRYKLDQRVHQGSWQENADNVTLTIEGVNVDTPINATFENGALNVPEQGEMTGQTFNKMQGM